ncbi:uncharacterized protein LOC143294737 isoform X2 [Babylonia areolata]|uniref:uncharacterized protein LOC143294737 isoform X2 n=1 Tax=Babylonia areolata TaxID=304850 RepID=UPI003FCF402E
MASEGGGKIKSKRGHSSSKPYERKKSLLSRITDSIKEVLRPSWLATDDGQTPEDRDRPGVSSAADEEDEFVSPVQSPSLLPGHSVQGLRIGDGSPQSVQHGDVTRSTCESSLPWLQRTQVSSSTWENRSRAVKTTWGNSPSTFDKSQISRGFFTQKINEKKQMANAVETTSRGLGGEAPAATSTSSLSGAMTRERLGRSREDEDSPDSASCSRLVQNEERTDSMLGSTSAVSSTLECAAEDNPSKRQRLWGPENVHRRKSQQQSPAHRPAFKMSVFSSPRLNESMHESSFYSGRTMYGGASAYRRSSLNSSLPYQNALPIRKSVTAKPLNNSGNAVLSSSATQILKTLERLSDTKRSRLSETGTDSLLSFTPTSYRKPSRPLQTSLPSRSLEMPVRGLPLRGPPVQHRQSPVAASIAKNRQVVSLPSQRPKVSSTVTQTTEERSSVVLEEDEDEDTQEQKRNDVPQKAEFPEPAPSRTSGKMKHQKSYDTRGRNRHPSREEDNVAELPNLRTDFTLPIGSMPAFNLGFPAFTTSPLAASGSASSAPKAASGMSGSGATTVEASVKSDQSPAKLQFTFSSPIHKSAPGPAQPSSSPATDFRFSSPLKVSDSMSADQQSTSAVTSGFSFGSSAQNTVSAWGSTEAKPKSGTAGNSLSSPMGGFGKVTSPVSSGVSATSSSVAATPSFGGPLKVASSLKSGSVMDVLGKSPMGSTSLGVKASSDLKQGSVMDVLGGKNDWKTGAASASPLKPAAELKPGSVMDILGKQSSSSGSDSLMNKFAPPGGSWECEVCMIQNTSDASKCVACSSSKPRQSSKVCGTSSSKPSVSNSNSLFAQFAPPAGSWECEACMVQNKADVDKCVACQTRKPGPVCGTSSSKPSVSSSNSLFAQFAPPAGSWECEACMVQNKADVDKCVACQTRKPGPVSAALKSSTSSGDSLFAKFVPEAGTWDCDACMLQNKPGVTKCVACDTLKPGATAPLASTSGQSDSLMAKFKRPTGDWDCDVCLVQNTAAHTKCAACQSPRPGAMAAGTEPPAAPAPAIKLAPGGGLTFTLPSTPSSSSPSPFLAGSSTSTQPSTGGFKFPATSSTSSTSSATGGFQFGSSSGSTAPSTTGGFNFGQHDTSNSASTLSSTGFTFGVKDSTAASATSSSVCKTVSPASSSFQFGMSSSSAVSAGSGFTFGSSTAATTTSSSSATCVTTSAFALGSTTGTGGFQFGAAAQTQTADTKNEASKLTTSESVSRTEGLTFSPVFGAGKPSNSFPLGAAPSVVSGSVSSLTTGGFQFQGPTSSGKDSTPSPFLASPTVSASETPKTNNGSAASKSSSLPGGFSFSVPAKPTSNAAPKSGLFASAETDSSKNGVTSTTPSSSASQGFMFGAASSGSSLPTNLFSSVPQLSSASFPASKLPVNGEVEAQAPFSFGQPSVPASSATGGFIFGAPVGGKDSGSTSNSLTQAKSFSFGGTDTATVSKSTTEKRHLDNDIGQSDAKKRPGLTGLSSTGGNEGFKFGNPTAGAGTDLFKFSQTSQGSQDKGASLSAFGGQAAGFGASMQGGFSFPNAASSTGVQQAGSVFGAGAGTGTGQFSFGLAAGSQSNAAAASPFGSDASSAPTQGFNFSGATQSSFNFGGNSTNTSAPLFQFGSSQTGEPAPAQPAGGGLFMFGQTAPSADSTAPSAGFGAAQAQGNFSIGTGDGPRKIKRAVRRTVRK